MADGNILLIDDEIEIRSYMQDFFEDRGFNVDIAGNGIEGVAKYKEKPDKYALVLSDMMMPQLNGLGVLKGIKEVNPAQKIIMITGVKEESMVAKAKDLGCLHYLNKPFSLSDLEARVNEALESS